MIAFLPSQAILPYEVPQIASLRGVRRIANFKIAGYTSKGKLRTVQTETNRTIGGGLEQVAITPELIAEPEVVHQRRLHCGGRSQDAVVARRRRWSLQFTLRSQLDGRGALEPLGPKLEFPSCEYRANKLVLLSS